MPSTFGFHNVTLSFDHLGQVRLRFRDVYAMLLEGVGCVVEMLLDQAALRRMHPHIEKCLRVVS